MDDTTTTNRCTTEPHVHFRATPCMLPFGHLVMVDHRPIAVCTSIGAAMRIADLLREHGTVDVPDRIPDSIMWGPPVLPPLIDLGLPEDPTIEGPR
jgi:hypothetical protein